MATEASARQQRRIATPEGIELILDLADLGERFGAFVLDFLLVHLGALLFGLGCWGLAVFLGEGSGAWLLALFLLGAFLARLFYFPWFELRWRGATPGKRALGLRVIERNGGPLPGEAVLVRNLMREAELFLPLSILLLAQPLLGLGFRPLYFAALLVWLGLFALMPLFNRERLRVGDMLAGTRVIALPKAVLPAELADGGRAGGDYDFSAAELDVYGIHELQTLEALLRRGGALPEANAREVARRIARRTGWNGGAAPEDVRGFLAAFYAAQRGRLEHKLLFGVRRRDKHDKG